MLSRSSKLASSQLLACIEAGGTKFNCELVTYDGEILAKAVFPTFTPDITLKEVEYFFKNACETHGSLSAIGIACFGPIELNKYSEKYGYITNTPKHGWGDTDIVSFFRQSFGVPVAFDTDVNAALLGEVQFGAARGYKNAIYVTVGTGIGAGIFYDGKLFHGSTHPEIGHMLVPRANGDAFPGACQFHHACLEGMASGNALLQRWSKNPATLSGGHIGWEFEAYYLAAMCVNLTHSFSPDIIVLGGGVMNQNLLLPMIHKQFLSLINGYTNPAIIENISRYIVVTELDGRAGVIGARRLARTLVSK